jgi:hypothetical protein
MKRPRDYDAMWNTLLWIVLAAIAMFYLVRVPQARADGLAPKLEPFAGYTHVSDIMRGPPFGPPVEACEPTTDWIGGGVTLTWLHVEIDLAHGFKRRDMWCGRPYAQPWESGTELALRWYPWRR